LKERVVSPQVAVAKKMPDGDHIRIVDGVVSVMDGGIVPDIVPVDKTGYARAVPDKRR